MGYDLIIVGGGLGGSALAKALAERGARVLVFEREKEFKDRVRGEGMHPWGVAEARAVGIYGSLIETCGHQVRWWSRSFGSTPSSRRDLIETTPQHAGCLDFYHPEMQRVLLGLAASAGAEVRRGTVVTAVVPGKPPTVLARANGHDEEFRARLVVGADGRSSRVRGWAGFAVKRDPEKLVIAGVLHAGLRAPEDSVHVIHNPPIGQGALVFPIGQQRFRSYFIYRKRGTPRALSGRQRAADFVAACVETGAPQEWYRDAEVAGPLAAFEAADTWVEHPYQHGVALIGDAAAANDPSWGCGLSLTLRDVRVLRDQLLANTDWEAAARAYAEEHDQYYGALHRLESWLADLLYEVGPEADARRARVFPRLAREPERAPDVPGLGPDAPSDEAARRRLFVED